MRMRIKKFQGSAVAGSWEAWTKKMRYQLELMFLHLRVLSRYGNFPKRPTLRSTSETIHGQTEHLRLWEEA